nr:hypothetical protein [Tanacetum cinerariifolium]
MVDTRTDNGGVLTGSNNVESQLTSLITDITHLADRMIALVNKLNGDGGTSQKKGNLGNQNGQNSCNGSDSGSLMGHVNDDDVSLGKGIRRNGEIGNGKIDALKVLDEMSSIKFLKQDGSVQEYYDACVYSAKRFGWNDVFYVSIFINRLQPEIKEKIKIFKPKTLYDAYCVAILQESTNEFLRKCGSKNVDSNTLVLDVSDCLDSEGIEIVNTIEKNDGKQDIGNDIEEEEVMELNDASGEIDISIGLMGIRLMDCDDKVCYNAGKEYVKVKGIQSKNSKGDDGNKKCLQNYNDILKGGKLMDNGQVICRNRGMSKVAWKPLVKMRMNGSILGENSGDADYVVINESVVSESINSEKMIILLTHVVSCVKWGLSESKGKDLNNLMSSKDANKNGVNSCYWELSGCKWRGRKKTCGIFCQVKNKWKFDIWRWPKRKKKYVLNDIWGVWKYVAAAYTRRPEAEV